MKMSHPAADVPYPIVNLNRIPKQRYYDQKFYDLEVERLWPRVWQMACRLEEIPNPGDYVEYEILDQSVLIVRVDANRVKAYHNACRHRGVQLAKDRGNVKQGFSCPFHGWRFNLEGENTFLYQPDLFAETERDKDDLRLRECRIDFWAGFAFINFDDNAPPLRESIEPFASYNEARGAAQMRTKWWHSTILPVNWKLSMEAFMEGYHVMRTHPYLLPSFYNKGQDAVYRPTGSKIQGSVNTAVMVNPQIDVDKFLDSFMIYMNHMSDRMDAMILKKDIEIAQKLRDTVKLPADLPSASKEWALQLYKALTEGHRKAGIKHMPDLVELSKTLEGSVQYCFPHFFLLPTYGNMASYRIRPLGPESTLFEIWSLTLYPEGEEPPPPKTPVPMACDDPRWPPLPQEDFSNLAIQQKGLHTKGFEFMRLSPHVEGLISRYHQVIDDYLTGVDSHDIVPNLKQTNIQLDSPVAKLKLTE